MSASNNNPQGNSNLFKIILLGVAIWIGLTLYNQHERRRQAELDRQNAAEAGAFFGGFLRGVSE